jgi:signal peptidase II
MTELRTKAALYLGIVGSIVAIDIGTKLWVQNNLRLYDPVPIIGDYVRLTYIYNPGAAFGLHLGPYSRVFFLTLSLAAIVILFMIFRSTPLSDRPRLIAVALVTGGALGNLVDRVRSPRGVVDFLDVGLETVRWPVFNVADIAVTTGAILLALSLWREEQREPGDGGG